MIWTPPFDQSSIIQEPFGFDRETLATNPSGIQASRRPRQMHLDSSSNGLALTRKFFADKVKRTLKIDYQDRQTRKNALEKILETITTKIRDDDFGEFRDPYYYQATDPRAYKQVFIPIPGEFFIELAELGDQNTAEKLRDFLSAAIAANSDDTKFCIHHGALHSYLHLCKDPEVLDKLQLAQGDDFNAEGLKTVLRDYNKAVIRFIAETYEINQKEKYVQLEKLLGQLTIPELHYPELIEAIVTNFDPEANLFNNLTSSRSVHTSIDNLRRFRRMQEDSSTAISPWNILAEAGHRSDNTLAAQLTFKLSKRRGRGGSSSSEIARAYSFLNGRMRNNTLEQEFIAKTKVGELLRSAIYDGNSATTIKRIESDLKKIYKYENNGNLATKAQRNIAHLFSAPGIGDQGIIGDYFTEEFKLTA